MDEAVVFSQDGITNKEDVFLAKDIKHKSRDIDFRHPISECPEMSAMHGSIQNIEGDFIEEENEFESSALEFLENDD